MGVCRLLFSLAVFATVSACANYDLDSGRNMEVAGERFIDELYPRYEALSIDLQARGDSRDSEHFNHKARNAGMGSPVLPDEPMDRNLDPDSRSTFEAARYDLLLFFNDLRARERAPATAADAQVSFDCWMEAVEAGRDQTAEQCRRAFEDAMASLAAETPDTPRPFVVYFAFDSATVDGTGQAIIDRAIAEAARFGAGGFSVTGHTDRAGSEDYNARLSLDRAQAVAATLRARGISASDISIAGRGESENAVATADGIREQKNRRVEIVVQ